MIDGQKHYLKSQVGIRIPVLMVSISSRLTYAAVRLRKQLTAQNRLDYVSTGAFLVFIIAAFFVRKPSGLAVGAIVLGGLLSFSSGAALEVFRRNVWFGLFGMLLGVWMLLAAAIGSPGYQVSDFFNLVLLGAFFLFIAQASRSLSTRQVLSIIAIIGGASAFASILMQFISAAHPFERMFPLGRSGNPTPGAGGFAIALIAVMAMWLDGASKRGLALASLGLAMVLLVALAWTQSRAPIIAFGLAVPLAFWLYTRGGSVGLLIACLAAWATVTGLIMFEQNIKALFCGSEAAWCRPAHRTEIWVWVRRQIELHPLLGSGPSFRFDQKWMSHPHNGLFGVAMFYGLVIFAAFGAMIIRYVATLTHVPNRALRFFGVASLIFSFGYMGADLSNPFAYFNMHYLFLWLPFFLVLASRQTELH